MHSSTYKVMNKQYYINKAEINRRNNKQASYRINIYNNTLIDQLIENQNNNKYEKPTDAMLYADIEALNKPSVYNNYKALMNSPYIKNDSVQQLLIQNKANKDLNRIVEKELATIKNNLDYVQKVIDKYDIPEKQYRKEINNENSMSNRKKIIEKVHKEIAVANNMKPGMNIPIIQPYQDLNFVSENLLRENRMTSEYNLFEEENRLAEENGEDAPHEMKSWVWTGNGLTTRHESNDGQTVPFNEPFEIVNDATGEVDLMMYPCDPAGSPGNSYICYCELSVNGKL